MVVFQSTTPTAAAECMIWFIATFNTTFKNEL